MEAFWKGEVIDRCCVGVLAPRRTSRLPPFPELQWGPWLEHLAEIPPENAEEIRRWWTDPERNYNRMIRWFDNTAFLGEACPATYVNWGASALAAIAGSVPVFGTKSVWYPKVIEDWASWSLHVETTCGWWASIVDVQRMLVDRCDGRYLVGTPELGPASDVLSLLRGMDTLALDLFDNPDEVHRAVKVLSEAWVSLHESVYGLNRPVNGDGAVVAWMNLWAPGRHDQVACDFSASISPELFWTFFAPEIRKEAGWCEYATYHMDGPDCIARMLDRYLEIEEIDCIEFTPGAGQPPTSHPGYFPHYRKILGAGKKLYLLAKPREVETILAELPPEGLWLKVDMESEEEGETLLRQVARWSTRAHRSR
jgi:hypothetical protein